MSVIIIGFLVVGAAVVFFELKKKNVGIWIGSYLKQILHGVPELKDGEPIHIIFCRVDHFEPIQKGSTKKEERERMKTWMEGYPELANKHCDSDGRVPQHTWFYPGEAYEAEYLDGLSGLCQKGYGEIEFHHHHHYESSESLRKSFLSSLEKFSKHGALSTNGDMPRHHYGFIHGNMALDNSRFDDQWCGVNNELTILKETGCYADFSAPTAPCSSQTKKINSIYYAKDDPENPKSHDDGVDVEVGKAPSGDLMIIQGPLAPNWKKKKFGILPTIDNGEILKSDPPTPDRVDRWIRQHIHVKGKPNWVFVKVSCHGAQNKDFDVVLGESAHAMYEHLEENYKDKNRYRLHYVTAREMYNMVKAAEADVEGVPDAYRNFILQSPENRRSRIS